MGDGRKQQLALHTRGATRQSRRGRSGHPSCRCPQRAGPRAWALSNDAVVCSSTTSKSRRLCRTTSWRSRHCPTKRKFHKIDYARCEHLHARHCRISSRRPASEINHPCGLLLKAARGVTIALVSSCERKRRQPGLATDGPEFVGWHQLVGGIQGPQVHFYFVCGAREDGRAAAGTEKPPGVVACFAFDRHRVLRKHRGSVKKSPVMLAAVETMTKADPVWAARRHNSDVAAQATAGETVHAAYPPSSALGTLTTTPAGVHERCASLPAAALRRCEGACRRTEAPVERSGLCKPDRRRPVGVRSRYLPERLRMKHCQ